MKAAATAPEQGFRQVATGDSADLGLGRPGLQQPPAPAGGPEQHVVRDGDGHERAGIERSRDGPGGLVQILGENRRGVGNEGHQEKQQAIRIEESRTRTANEVEDRVVVGPHDQDREEAHDEGDVGGPLRGQGAGERIARPIFQMRDLDLEDEQRDRDGEDASLKASIRPVSFSWASAPSWPPRDQAWARAASATRVAAGRPRRDRPRTSICRRLSSSRGEAPLRDGGGTAGLGLQGQREIPPGGERSPEVSYVAFMMETSATVNADRSPA